MNEVSYFVLATIAWFDLVWSLAVVVERGSEMTNNLTFIKMSNVIHVYITF